MSGRTAVVVVVLPVLDQKHPAAAVVVPVFGHDLALIVHTVR